MKPETRIGTNGRTLTILTPEDQREIDRLAAAGEINVAHSFEDQPEKRSRLNRLRRLAAHERMATLWAAVHTRDTKGFAGFGLNYSWLSCSAGKAILA